ncbi:hypothetical protein WEI85_46070 [Actinomycetes bacterium KLBMP 9797]
MREVLPGGVFGRGSTVEVLGPGSTFLLFAVIAAASGGKAWSAVVGMNDLGMVAAADVGIALERFAVVPEPGPQWLRVVAALADGVDILAVRPPSPVAPADRQRLAARVRQRGTLLLATAPWDGADVTLRVSGQSWYGLGQGCGRVKARTVDLTVHGRGALARTRDLTLWLPAPTGEPIAAYEPVSKVRPQDRPVRSTVA